MQECKLLRAVLCGLLLPGTRVEAHIALICEAAMTCEDVTATTYFEGAVSEHFA
jgi:hypothetical protein